MNPYPFLSEIDGRKHQQNCNLLGICAVANDVLSFRTLAEVELGPVNNCLMLPPTSYHPKAFVCRDDANGKMLIVIGGSDSRGQVDALIAEYSKVQNPLGRGVEPYATGAREILPQTTRGNFTEWNEITIIGYSMGGAVAMCLAAELYKTEPTRQFYVYGYGSPRYSHKTQVNWWRGSTVIQVFMAGDPIPILPPSFNEDPVFNLYCFNGLGSGGLFAARNSSGGWNSPMTEYELSHGILRAVAAAPQVYSRQAFPIAEWVLGTDYLGADSHHLSTYQSEVAKIPAAVAPSLQPRTVPAASVNAPRISEVQRTQMTRRALQTAGLTTATDPNLAVQQTQQAIISHRGTYYHRKRIGKVPVITYDGQIVLVCKGIRDQKRITKKLNANLRRI